MTGVVAAHRAALQLSETVFQQPAWAWPIVYNHIQGKALQGRISRLRQPFKFIPESHGIVTSIACKD